MSEEIKCFLLVPTGYDRRSLRRYSESDGCPFNFGGYHNALNFIEKTPTVDRNITASIHPPWNDARWPKACNCSYKFTAGDAFQVFIEELFEANGLEMTIREAPAGAMWWAPWMSGFHSGGIHKRDRGDGPHLLIKTPFGDWDIDAPSSNSPDGWQRTGEPPQVTASPSIDMNGKWHGFLTGGKLIRV